MREEIFDSDTWIEVVDREKVRDRFYPHYTQYLKLYNMNVATRAIPLTEIRQYEQACMEHVDNDQRLYEYIYWRLKLCEQILPKFDDSTGFSNYKCHLPAPYWLDDEPYFPVLMSAISQE